MLKKLLLLSCFFFLTLAIYLGFNSLLFPDSITFNSITIIHVFLFSLTLVFFLLLHWLKSKNVNSPFIFLGLNFVKMVGSLIFLLPIIKTYSTNDLPYILHFFTVYFIYLSYEILLIIKFEK